MNWFPYEGESWDDDERDPETADELPQPHPGDLRRDRGWRAGDDDDDVGLESGRWPLGPHGLLPQFRFALTGDDVTRGKPDPEIYLKAAARLGVQPAEMVVLEDSLNGLIAAKAAGAGEGTP